MRVQLAQQAQEILGTSDLVIITERVDDVALLIGQMVKMGLPEVLDRHIPRHIFRKLGCYPIYCFLETLWLLSKLASSNTSKDDKKTSRRLFPTNVSTDGMYIPGVKN